MPELTDRQIRILRSIIEEYIETAEPVGSNSLEKKYELGVSPATIRNEMVRLTDMGYLKQPHTSAGRVPSKSAFKFYVQEMMQEKQLSVADEVAAKEQVWEARFDLDKLMRETVKTLATRTKALAVAATDDGDIYHAGYANVLEIPEFYDIDITRTIFSMLDEEDPLRRLFGRSFSEGPIHLLLGDELGYDFLEPCGMVFTNFNIGAKKHGSLGIIGPSRLNYSQVIPIVRYFGNLIEELTQNL